MQGTQTAREWAEDSLHQNGYGLTGDMEVIRDMPWSTVSRFPTTKGFIYFKKMAPPFSIEPTVLHALHAQFAAQLPEIIDENSTLHCFLMNECGAVLRDKLHTHWESDLFGSALTTYANMQKATANQVDALLAAGLQDWRLHKLPQLYQNFMRQEELLLGDGLTMEDIKTLQKLAPQFSELCQQLLTYPIPETLEHGDFHDNNILIKDRDNNAFKNESVSTVFITDKRIIINDWGDATISHPFLSLASCLNSAERHHGLKENDERYNAIKNAYLENWREYASEASLLEAFGLAKNIRLFQFTLSFSRIAMCPGIEAFPQYKGYMAEALRELKIILL